MRENEVEQFRRREFEAKLNYFSAITKQDADTQTPEPLASIIRSELFRRKLTGMERLAITEKKLKQPTMTIKKRVKTFLKSILGGWRKR